MRSLLILTIGTGTRGQHSNLAAGMVATLRKMAPRLYWLVPSIASDSQETANLVREETGSASAFVPWTPSQLYRSIREPDNLFDCRAAIRDVVEAARGHLQKGERLVVNPTSGTKQMSVGAALAALDAEIGEIVFTTGSRADGVVITGTEQLSRFDTRPFFIERTYREGKRLFEAGSCRGAASLFGAYRPELAGHEEVAACLYEWQRLNYEAARQIAARSSAAELSHCRGYLDRLARAPELSIERLGDLLASADALLAWNEPEEALARYYRAMELAARIRLALEHGISAPYSLSTLQQAAPRLARIFAPLARDGSVVLGLRRVLEVLDALSDPFTSDFWSERSLDRALSLRNETFAGHGTKPADPRDVQTAKAGLRRLLPLYFPDLDLYWTLQARPALPPLP